MASLLRTLTYVTGSIAAGASTSRNDTIVGNIADIVKIKVTPSNINTGELVQYSIYKHNTFLAADLVYNTTSFNGNLIDPIETDGVTTTERNEGFVAHYEDGDNVQQLHNKISNNGTVAKTYAVTITYKTGHDDRGRFPLVTEFGADPTGASDSSAAFNAALAAFNNVGVPNGTYKLNTTITLGANQSLIATNMPQRWRSGIYPVKLDYHGTGACITLAPGSSAGMDTVYLRGLHIDGSNASGAVDGLLLDASASSSYIEGVIVKDCAITNFPQYQVHSKQTVFDVLFENCSIHNSGRAADNVVQITTTVAAAPGQWSFTNCWIMAYTATKWCIFAGRDGVFTTNAITALRITNGTVAPNASGAGANGIWVYGGLTVIGTHLENAQESAQAATIGIRYTGSNGGFIAPGICSFFGTGLEIGDSTNTATDAGGCVVFTGIGFNLTAGQDINIIGAGFRRGTVIFPQGNFPQSGSFGQSDGRALITNSATNPGDVFMIQSSAGANGYMKVGTQLHLDDNNSRVGIGGVPAVALDVWCPHNNGIRVTNKSNSNRIAAQLVADASDGGNAIVYNSAGIATVTLNGAGWIDAIEVAAPTAPGANTVRLYAKDNGAGKTQLMAQFPTGAAQQIAIEP